MCTSSPPPSPEQARFICVVCELQAKKLEDVLEEVPDQGKHQPQRKTGGDIEEQPAAPEEKGIFTQPEDENPLYRLMKHPWTLEALRLSTKHYRSDLYAIAAKVYEACRDLNPQQLREVELEEKIRQKWETRLSAKFAEAENMCHNYGDTHTNTVMTVVAAE